MSRLVPCVFQPKTDSHTLFSRGGRGATLATVIERTHTIGYTRIIPSTAQRGSKKSEDRAPLGKLTSFSTRPCGIKCPPRRNIDHRRQCTSRGDLSSLACPEAPATDGQVRRPGFGVGQRDCLDKSRRSIIILCLLHEARHGLILDLRRELCRLQGRKAEPEAEVSADSFEGGGLKR